jgi:hypothetical protein
MSESKGLLTMAIQSTICITALVLAIAAIPVAGQVGTGVLKTKVNPGRAGVFVDGKYVGPAGNFGFSRKYSVPAGEHEIKLSEPRYEDLVKKITVQPGQTITLVETLKAVPLAQPPFGKLRTISTDKFAAVFVNGKYMGHVDEFSNSMQVLLLNPGVYTVKVVPVASGAPHEEQVRVEADKTTIVRASH